MFYKKRIKSLLAMLLICLFTSGPIQAAQERYALIIGNADYGKEVGALKNPVNDAAAMASSLEAKGFTVTHLQNASKRQMEGAFRQFSRNLRLNAVGLFFFAGHAIEVDGENYLIPIGSYIEDEVDAKYEAVSVGRLLDSMDRAGNGLNLVVLDACRNNPYSRRFRSAKRGLTMMYPASGTMILYATEPGNVAADGEGDNGVFTEHLLDAIETPGLSVEEAFKQTAIAVKEITRGKQVPWYEGIILGQFTFIPSNRTPNTQNKISAQTSTAVNPQSQELVFWKSVESKPTLAGYQAYLATYPEGVFSALAKARVKESGKMPEAKPMLVKPGPVRKKQETPVAKPKVSLFSKKSTPGTNSKLFGKQTTVNTKSELPDKKMVPKPDSKLPKRIDDLKKGNQLVFLRDVKLDSKGKVIFRKGDISRTLAAWEWDCIFSGKPGEVLREGTVHVITGVEEHSMTISGGDEESTVKLELEQDAYNMRCYASFRQSTTTRMQTAEFLSTVGDYIGLR